MKELLEKIVYAVGVDESVIQLAEECAELIQAATKFRRAMNGTTPVSLAKAQENLIEEMADVRVCIDEMVILLDSEFSRNTEQQLLLKQQTKVERWAKRLKLFR